MRFKARRTFVVNNMSVTGTATLPIALICLAGLSVTVSCSRQPDDSLIVKSLQAQVQRDLPVSSGVKVESANGFVTLSGSVASEEDRALAARDATLTTGVKGVFNYLAMDAAIKASSKPTSRNEHRGIARRRQSVREAPDPVGQAALPETPVAVAAVPPVSVDPAPPVSASSFVPPPPAAPAAPPPLAPIPIKHVLQSGTILSIRLIDLLDSARNQVGDTFRATLKAPVSVDGDVVIPAGADIEGRVVDVSNAGRFTGHSELNLELTKLTSDGTIYPVQTEGYDRAGDGRGKGTAETVGGGAVLGAIIGAIAGGGKGAGIGSAAGAGAGGATRAATSRKRITFPSETVLTFKLQEPLTVVTTKGPGGDQRTSSRP